MLVQVMLKLMLLDCEAVLMHAICNLLVTLRMASEFALCLLYVWLIVGEKELRVLPYYT